MSYMGRFNEILTLVAQSTDEAELAREKALSDLVVAEAFALGAGATPDKIAGLVDVQCRKNTLKAYGVEVDDGPFCGTANE